MHCGIIIKATILSHFFHLISTEWMMMSKWFHLHWDILEVLNSKWCEVQPSIIQMPVLLERAFTPQASQDLFLWPLLDSFLTVWALRWHTSLSFHSLSYRCLKPFLPMVASGSLKKFFLKYIQWWCWGNRIRPRSSQADGQAQVTIKISVWLYHFRSGN